MNKNSIAPARDKESANDLRCVRFGCDYEPLAHMEPGQSRQTENGFFTIMIGGLYCPRCGAGYGSNRKT
jgi:hypothetical protein